MHICFKIINFYYTLRCSTCFGHYCVGSNNRKGLEDATNTTPHGNQRLPVQWWKSPDDGHSSVRNM
jgi:hypothetical protein